MEKIAIISDIHANLEALKTVLKDIKSKGIKRIFCLGDIIGKGAHPKECIDLILSKCEIIISGNLEDLIINKTENISERRAFYLKQLGDYRNKKNQLPFCHEFYMSGSLIRLYHASPVSVYERINKYDHYKNKVKAFYPGNNTISQEIADIVIFGDLHTQFMDKFYNKTLINCGSVGNSIDIFRNNDIDSDCMETTQAFYLIIGGEMNSKQYNSNLSFNFIRVPYDIEKELNTKNEIVEKELYALEIKKGIYRDIHLLDDKYDI